MECSDFDYCFKCFWTCEKTHPDHSFEKVGEGPERSPEYESVK